MSTLDLDVLISDDKETMKIKKDANYLSLYIPDKSGVDYDPVKLGLYDGFSLILIVFAFLFLASLLVKSILLFLFKY